MAETLQLGDVVIAVARKNVKHVHLSVHPPNGRITLVAPTDTRLEVAHAYAASKLHWIREQQDKLRAQPRETPRQFIERESHYLWGRRYLMSVIERDGKPEVSLDHRRIVLSVRPGSSQAKRAEVIHEWHKTLLHQEVPAVIERWEPRLQVEVNGYFLQRMKTKWGSCNSAARNIRLNTELVKKPKDLLEYIVVHEMAHLIEPTHSDRFIAILDERYPTWRDARAELNDLPLAAETWRE
jgi:predicted metal-dependent hydrolase